MNASVLKRSWPIAREMTTTTVKFVLVAWGIILGILAVGLSIYAMSAQPEVSVADFATHAPRYWIGGWAIAITVVMLRSYVAIGYTRSEYYVGLAVAGVAMSLSAAAAMTVTLGLETGLYAVMGWDNSITDGGSSHLYAANSQLGLAFAETSVIYAGHMAAGILIGAIYNRIHNVVVATCLAVASYAFAALAEATVGSGWPGVIMGLTGQMEPSALTGVVGGALTVGAALTLGWFVIRNAPIRTKRA